MWRSPTPVRVRKPDVDMGEGSSKGMHLHPQPQHYQHDDDLSPFASPVRNLLADAHRQRISRHRHVWAPPATPPEYWTIEFPTTQQAAEINRRAEDMHIDKRRRIEMEALSKNGRFVRRDKQK